MTQFEITWWLTFIKRAVWTPVAHACSRSRESHWTPELVKKQMSEQTTTANLDSVTWTPNKQRRFNKKNSGKQENHTHNQTYRSHSEIEDECTKCRHVHRIPNKCRAQWVICRYCHQKWHYASCCFKKRHRSAEQRQVHETEPFLLEEVWIGETSPWLVNLYAMNTEISFKSIQALM